MQNLAAISLEHDWQYFFAESPRTDYSAISIEDYGWIPLPALSDWSIAAATRAGADWFRHTLILDVVPTSVRYLMQIDGAPEGVQVYINGHFIGKTQHRRAFNADVTDWLVSPRNVIALKIAQHEGRGGAFGRLRLQPVPAGF